MGIIGSLANRRGSGCIIMRYHHGQTVVISCRYNPITVDQHRPLFHIGVIYRQVWRPVAVGMNYSSFCHKNDSGGSDYPSVNECAYILKWEMKILIPSQILSVQPGMNKYFHITLYWACGYLSMLGLTFIHASKGGAFSTIAYPNEHPFCNGHGNWKDILIDRWLYH